MLKKFISVLAATAMLMTVSVTAFAASETVSTIEGNNYTITFDREVEVKTETLAEFQNAGGEAAATEVTVYQIPVGTKITVSSSKDGIVYTRSDLTGASGVLQMDGTWDNKGSFSYNAKNTFANGSAVSYKEVMPKKFFCYEYFVRDSNVRETSVPIRVRVTGSSTPAPTAPAKPATQQGNGGSGVSEPAPGVNNAAAPQATAKAAPVSVTTDGTTYTAKAGDNLGLLALNNYGSYHYWDELYSVNAAVLKNSNGKLYAGLNIVIPTTIAKGVSIIAPATAGAGEKLYTVQSGDTLGTIAFAEYKDMSKCQAIFERNSDRLATVNAIYAGQIIVLPAK